MRETKLKTLRWLALILVAAAAAAHAEGKIGYVNLDRILRDSEPAKRAQRKLEGDFSKRDQELAKAAENLKRMQETFDKNVVTMSESDRRNRERELGEANREFQRKQREMREDFNQKRNEELAEIINAANKAVRQIAEGEKFDIIFQEAVYANPRIDITDKVIRMLDQSPAKK
jgi:outer membrane protein